MDVQSTQAALRQSGESLANAHKADKAGDSLGKEDFLRLLMTQMTNQDPLNPLDSKGMMEQFAQMGTLEQLSNINGKLETLNAVQGQIARANAYTYIDKDVTVKGGKAQVADGLAPTVSYTLPRDATVRVHITNGDNAPVRNLDLGFQGPGNHQIAWDGKDDDGDAVANGSYSYNVVAQTDDGTEVPVDLYVKGKVANVRFENGKQLLQLNGADYDASEVVGVSTESERRFGGRSPMELRSDMTPMPPVPERTR